MIRAFSQFDTVGKVIENNSPSLLNCSASVQFRIFQLYFVLSYNKKQNKNETIYYRRHKRQ